MISLFREACVVQCPTADLQNHPSETPERGAALVRLLSNVLYCGEVAIERIQPPEPHQELVEGALHTRP
jgi:hypothetical protein